MPPMSKFILGLLAIVLVIAAGCHPSLPKTYTAGGSVHYKGGQPMKGGSVQFASPTDPLLRIIGQIQEDGTFVLVTIRDNDRTSGAPEGEYEVTVQPPLLGEHKGAPSIVLPTRYKVVGGQKNEFAVQLNVPPPS